MRLPARAGPFTITAIADRIDRLRGGELVVIDYKTGSLPSTREIEQAVAVQLPLEGAIARDGSFGGLQRRAGGARILAAVGRRSARLALCRSAATARWR